LSIGSVLRDLSGIHDQNAVAFPEDGGMPRDHNARAIRLLQRVARGPAGDAVQRVHRLVKHVHARLRRNGSGHQQPLTMVNGR